MAGHPTLRRVVVSGAVLCSCLLVLLGTAPTAAVVPSGGNPGGTASAGQSGAERGVERTPGETVGIAAVASGDTANCDGGSARADDGPDGTDTAVLDRVEDGLAVLEISDGEDDTRELVVEVDDLPADGRHPNAVFEIRVTDGELRDATYDRSRSESRREAAQERFDGLASRPADEDEGDEEGDEEG